MCCQEDAVLALPPAVIEALAHYRRLADERGFDWGGEGLDDFFRWARFSRLGDVMTAAGETGDWAGAVRSVVDAAGGDPGVLRVDARRGGDGTPRLRPGPRRFAIAGRSVPVDLVVEADPGSTVEIDGGPVAVPDTGVVLDGRTIDGVRPVVTIDGVELPAVEVVEAVALTLRSDDWSRWSVVDDRGGAWFPDGVPAKWDGAHRPFFHAREVALTVPAVPLTVRCARGPEFTATSDRVDPTSTPVVGTTLGRTHDPASDGWHSADLHVHLNYSGDVVVTPDQALAMQRGEDLALLNLTAGNLSGARVYDRELLEHTAARDLWHDGRHVARAGVEFRNDLLGHVHALGPDSAPTRYQTGHDGSEHPHDHPPNADACSDLRRRGATVGYAHPVFAGLDDIFAIPRMPEARSLVIDAALGLVDSVDLVHCWDPRGGTALYHRLLNCGLRLAATAGSDVFLSFAHGPGVASNPPGWGRMYADLDGAPVSVDAYRDAIRAGRSLATTGPFLTLDVAGSGPGAEVGTGDLPVRVTRRGAFEGALRLVGPDGVLAETDGPDLVTTVRGEGWLAAAFEGGPHPLAPEMPVTAHTTPVWVGPGSGRADDARWCLDFLDRLDTHLDEHGRFADDPATRARQRADHVAGADRARAFYRELLTG